MTDVKSATCHFIVGHPSSPKFMVVKHAGGNWLPPTLPIPMEDPIDTKAQYMNERLRDQYGLDVVMLRHLVETKNYHCVEVDFRAPGLGRKLEAVWVGKEEYEKFRIQQPGRDPFAEWLLEAERKRISPFRRPWQKKAWFKQASNWIDLQISRAALTATGPLKQIKAFSQFSALMRIPTDGGALFFKAGAPVTPNEAILTRALASRYSNCVPMPMSIEPDSVWLLSRDYGPNLHQGMTEEQHFDALTRMADLQLGSVNETGQWAQLHVPEVNAGDLSDFVSHIDRLKPILESSSRISSEELSVFDTLAKVRAAEAQALEQDALPNMLVHQDFRPANLYQPGDHLLITDWANTVLSHPFMVLNAWERQAKPSAKAMDAYLERFEAYGERSVLREILDSARKIWPVFEMYHWSSQMHFIEPGSVAEARSRGVIVHNARKMLEQGHG